MTSNSKGSNTMNRQQAADFINQLEVNLEEDNRRANFGFQGEIQSIGNGMEALDDDALANSNFIDGIEHLD